MAARELYCLVNLEDFERYTDGQDLSSIDRWVVAVPGTFTGALRNGSIAGKLHRIGATAQIEYYRVFNPRDNDVFSIFSVSVDAVSITTNLLITLYVSSNPTVELRLLPGGDLQFRSDAVAWTTITTGLVATGNHVIDAISRSEKLFDFVVDGVVFNNGGAHYEMYNILPSDQYWDYVQFTLTGGGEVYLDDLQNRIQNDGFKRPAYTQLGRSSNIFLRVDGYQPVEAENGNIGGNPTTDDPLFDVAWYMSRNLYQRWLNVNDTGLTYPFVYHASWSLLAGVPSRIQPLDTDVANYSVAERRYNADISRQIGSSAYSPNVGAIYGHDLFRIGSTNYILILTTTQIQIFTLPFGGAPVPVATLAITVSAPVNGYGRGREVGGIFYFACVDGINLNYYQFDPTGPAITLVGNIGPATLYTQFVNKHDNRSLLISDDGTTIYVPCLAALATPAVYKSTDSGATFANWATRPNLLVHPGTHILAAGFKYVYDLDSEELLSYDDSTDTFDVLAILTPSFDPVNETYVPLAVTGGGKVFFAILDVISLNILENVLMGLGAVDDDRFQLVNISHEATEAQNHAEFYLTPEGAEEFTAGAFVDFRDGFGNLAFQGVILQPKNTAERARFRLQAAGFGRALQSKVAVKYTDKTTTEIITDILNNLDNVYPGDIDPDVDFTLIYTRKVQGTAAQFFNFARMLERAVVYMEPDGTYNVRRYDRLLDTGIRWDEGHGQVRLIEYHLPDMQVTRSVVVGAHNNVGQVKSTYIGDAVKEVADGVDPVEMNDNNLLNYPETDQIAENLYKIYANENGGRQPHAFIKLRVQNHGFLQPGMLVDFKWDDENVSIPRGLYMVIALDPLELKTNVATLWLTDSILTLGEVLAVQKKAGRDEELLTTYADEDAPDSTAGQPVVQNSVNRLRAGTYVWRTPEAITWDYNSQTAPPNGNVPGIGVAGWRLVPLAAIVPEGARAVHVSIQYQDNPSGPYFFLRKPGGAGLFQVTGGYVSTNNTTYMVDLACGIDENRDIDIYFSQAPNLFTFWQFVVLGWWI